jgi:hypothetical protein
MISFGQRAVLHTDRIGTRISDAMVQGWHKDNLGWRSDVLVKAHVRVRDLVG